MEDAANRIVAHYERHALSWDADRSSRNRRGQFPNTHLSVPNLAHGDAVGSYRGDPLYHASLDASEYEALLGHFGFELIEHSINGPQRGGRVFWLARAVHNRQYS